MTQDKVFVASEGDRWFGRNQKALEQFDPLADLPLALMRLYNLRPASALEIGAANGYRVAAIRDRHDAKAVAVEPSEQAVRAGRRRFPSVHFVQAEIGALPLRGTFDLVIVHFVLHWIDRTTLSRAVAEVDRVVAAGGFLIVGDFYPPAPTRVRYHHLPEHEIYTYKQDYASIFLALGTYRAVALLTGDHSAANLTAEADERDRIGVWLLNKLRTPAAAGPAPTGGAG